MNELDRAATQSHGLAKEIWQFLGASKKWWLLPFLVLFAAFGFVVFLSTSAAAPFIYTLF